MNLNDNAVKVSSFERDYFFDNLRLFLIFCVVFCHGIEQVRGDSDIIIILHETILSYMMPMFVFVTGFFSKNMADVNSSKRKKILNFIVLLCICQIIKQLIFGYDTFIQPHYGNWYLLAMVVYYYTLPLVAKIKPMYMMPLSILGGLLIGLEANAGALQLSRIISFFPFFLLGYYCTKENIDIVKTMKFRIIGIITLVLAIIVFVLFFVDIIPIGILQGNKNFEEMELSVIQGGIYRIWWYCFAPIMGFGICALIPRRKIAISFLGARTLLLAFA